VVLRYSSKVAPPDRAKFILPAVHTSQLAVWLREAELVSQKFNKINNTLFEYQVIALTGGQSYYSYCLWQLG